MMKHIYSILIFQFTIYSSRKNFIYMVLMQQTFKESGKYAFDHKPNCVYSSSFVSGCPGTVVIYEILFG